ncbi:MAG: isoleucine--tRNA ligase [Candidatus Aenigmarchaeota archaeon]|nr:isoleucine--tRNA ligase [Candidatus Aenigmarchaeota archaeon]
MLNGEQEVIGFWEKNRIYEKSKSARKRGKKYYFLDGPPYATGSIHMGTAQNKVLKDCYRRFLRMRGFDVWDQPGFDTHGLPIENKVEKKLGFTSKKDIENFGVGKFADECRKFATEHIGVMTRQFEGLGVWMDWKNPYLTLDDGYIEGAWLTFKKGFEKGLLYKGDYPVHVCPHCATAVAYNEIEHQKTRDPSLFVKFRLKGRQNEYLLIWTTTPWTLPANVAVMANPNAEYVKVNVGEEFLILSSRLLTKVMESAGIKEYKIVETYRGKDMEGMEYEHPLADIFTYQKELKAHRIVLSEQYVTLDDGTGLVHTAPGHGQEDHKVGIENGLPSVCPVKMDGTFDETCGSFSGMYIRKANPLIIEEMDSRGLLFKQDTLEHEYPFCWRCHTALILIAVPQWFFRVTKIREKLLSENAKVAWHPKWAGDRFKNWLESLGDWPISRQRYWGIPLPIWTCEKCGEVKVVGSRKELGKAPEDLHRPHIDSVVLKCKKCRSEMRRVPDVMDVWFDSGVAPWASIKDKKTFKRMWPADFVLEGPDQIRGWWNSMMIAGVMTFDRRPFDSVLFHGFVLDSHGVKMSKSKGNTVPPEDVMAKHGRDVLRYYFLSKPPWEDSYFKWEDVADISKSFIVVKNVFNFAKTYVPSPGKRAGLRPEDRWILSRLNSLMKSSAENMESRNCHKAARDTLDFVLNDFSRWYIKIIRDRTSVGYRGKDREAAFYTLYTVLKETTRLLAPFAPFMAEEMYQNVVLPIKKSKLSVHLEDWPAPDKKMIDPELEKDMAVAKAVFETSLAARQKAVIKLRWPVRSIVIQSDKKEVGPAVKRMSDILTSMCNSKIVAVSKKKPEGDFVGNDFDYGTLFLDKERDEWTRKEAMYRELTRFIQDMRKQNGFNVNDMISLSVSSDEGTNKKMADYKDELSREVGAKKVVFGKTHGKFAGDMVFGDVKIEVAFDKI